jgi:hypothetical protein
MLFLNLTQNIMKRILIFIFIALPILSYAQIEYDYEITVIDSFQCNGYNQAGVMGLGATVHNGDIHLAYHYQDIATAKKIYYSVRTDAGFSPEVVADSDVPANADQFNQCPAIQFDEFDNPHIYMGNYSPLNGEKELVVYDKIGNDWQSTSLGEFGGQNSYIAADPDGSNGLGFSYWGATSIGNYPIITYASFDGQNWEFEALSDAQIHPSRNATKATTVNYNNKTYVAYGEGHCPDTLITRVYVKDNLGWTLDYEDVNPTPWNCSNIIPLYTLIGKSNSGLALLTGLREENFNPIYVKNEGQGWESHAFEQYPSVADHGLGTPNKLLFDANNTAYWLSQDNGIWPTLNWRTAEGKGGTIGLPHFYGSLWLFDFVIKDDHAYIYYNESNCGSPTTDKPVTFKEIKIGLNQLLPTSTNDLNNYNFSLGQNQPNPFTEQTLIPFSLYQSSYVTLKIYDIMGMEISTLVNEKLSNGFYSKQFFTKNLPSGTYFYKLSVDGRTITRKFQITK